jgi:hypothetical protein
LGDTRIWLENYRVTVRFQNVSHCNVAGRDWVSPEGVTIKKELI